ncbi:hypothetical protein LUZ63_009690 [Rhynchospora breviuscula]|uniref:Uncharacterized protein n=1 Tax=Rhynchospora breviuscula TaxID=2022672 RepID=A0A9Q0CFY5_9POAL|nr:hypothetical protein LUZ63_009690 [Rhynchospora breviuscula]
MDSSSRILTSSGLPLRPPVLLLCQVFPFRPCHTPSLLRTPSSSFAHLLPMLHLFFSAKSAAPQNPQPNQSCIHSFTHQKFIIIIYLSLYALYTYWQLFHQEHLGSTVGAMASPHRKNSSIAHEGTSKVGDEVIVSPLELDIVWGEDSRYWHIDRNRRIAELKQVCWLHVGGRVKMKDLHPDTKYKLEFKIRMKKDAFGWNNSPVYIGVKPGEGNERNGVWASVDLSRIETGEQKISSIPSCLEFTTPSDVADGEVSFILLEIWKLGWKGGLVIDEVVISKV